MSCPHYGIPLAPLVANQSHIRVGSVHISNPVDGLETGGHFSLKTICPPGFVREDGQIHPNILFGKCRLLKKIHPFSEPTLKLSAMAGKRHSIKSVVFTLASWRHIFSKHSITDHSAFLAPPLGSNHLVFNSPPVIYHNILFSPCYIPLKKENVLQRLPFVLVLFCLAAFNGGYFLLEKVVFLNKK